MKKVISILLCFIILSAYSCFHAFASGDEIILDEVKYSNAEQVSIEDVKQAIKTNSLANAGDKERFINATTSDGKKFGDLVDISLTWIEQVVRRENTYIMVCGEALDNPATLYWAIWDKPNEGQSGEETLTVEAHPKDTGSITVNDYIFDYPKLAEIINNAGIGVPTSFATTPFGIRIETAKDSFIYTIKACNDAYGEKIKTDRYYLKANTVFTYSDYLKWESKQKENYALWQSYAKTKPVTKLDGDGNVVTTIPSETAKPSPTPDDNKVEKAEDKKTDKEVPKTEDSKPAIYHPEIDFTDIDDDDPLYNTLSTLTALNIISGYEDGTFKKDALVTRAETTKMILSAISPDDSAQAKRAQGLIGSGYSDVPREYWAASYLNIATDKFGFIHGYGNGIFSPENHVTYAEAVKMLVCCLGYEERASAVGGWPSGYLSIAAEIGITKNISLQVDVAATRENLAQLIYNALNAPILYAITFDKRTDANGVETLERQYVIMNEENNRGVSQTMLTWYQKAYVIEGVILNISGKDVNMRINESDNFESKKITSQNPSTFLFKNGINDFSPLIGKPVRALVQMKDDNLTIIQIETASSS